MSVTCRISLVKFSKLANWEVRWGAEADIKPAGIWISRTFHNWSDVVKALNWPGVLTYRVLLASTDILHQDLTLNVFYKTDAGAV